MGASALSVGEFGRLAVVGALILIIQAYGRSAFGEVLQVAFARLGIKSVEAQFHGARRQVVYVLFTAGVICLASCIAAVVRSDSSLSLVALVSLLCLALVACDLNRSWLLNAGMGWRDSVASGVGLGAQVAILGWQFAHSTVSVAGLLAAWLAYAGTTLLVQCGFARYRAAGPEWTTAQRGLVPWFAAETSVTVLATQGSTVVTGALIGASFAGSARGAFLLLFPISFFIQALGPTVVPTASRIWQRGDKRVYLIVAVASLVPPTFALIMSAFPGLVRLLLSDSSAGGLRCLPGVALYLAGQVAFIFPWAVLRGKSRPGLALAARAILSPFVILLPAVLGYVSGSDQGVGLGYGILGLLNIGASILLWSFALRSSRTLCIDRGA